MPVSTREYSTSKEIHGKMAVVITVPVWMRKKELTSVRKSEYIYYIGGRLSMAKKRRF